MSVVEAILAFDGRHVGLLKDAANSFQPEEAEPLVALCESDRRDTRIAATWIVKALCARDVACVLDMTRVFRRLEVETDWEPLLHLLQSVQYVPGSAATRRQAIERHLTHKKTLVRVWALDALVSVALETGEGVTQARSQVQRALKSDKASLRARARHLLKLPGL